MRTTFAFCFLGLMALLGGAGVFACLGVYRSKIWKTFAPNIPIVTSFRARFPFEGDSGADENGQVLSGRQGLLRSLSKMPLPDPAFVRKMTDRVDINLVKQNPLIGPFRHAVGTCDELVGNDLSVNGGTSILRLGNGYYTCLFPYSDATKTWTNIRDFADWLKARNIRCVHLLPPYKFDDRVAVFPAGIPHGYARMVSEYKQFLPDNEIPYLDAASVLLAENPNFFDWFYKVPNFHTARAGLTIAHSAAQKLNDELAIPADAEAVRAGNFTRTVYPRLFRAPPWAQGRDAAGEDFEVLYPKTGGCFHVEVPSLGLDRTGDFHDTIIAQDSLHSTCSQYGFLYGYSPLVHVENLTCPNSTRVLVIRRCDTGNICSYLACTVRHLDVIFPLGFDGSIRTFIEKTKPDVVMLFSYMQTNADDRFWRLR